MYHNVSQCITMYYNEIKVKILFLYFELHRLAYVV